MAWRSGKAEWPHDGHNMRFECLMYLMHSDILRGHSLAHELVLAGAPNLAGGQGLPCTMRSASAVPSLCRHDEDKNLILSSRNCQCYRA